MSSTGASKRAMKAAETRWGPAFTCTFGEVRLIDGLMSITATRAPLMEISICSPLVVLP
jgi:hypothetical protein